MVLLVFSSAHVLKLAVKLFMKFVKPGNEVMICFWPARAALQALSYDGCFQSFINFDPTSISQYICDQSCCYTLNIDELNAVVNLAADLNSVSILATAFGDFHLTVKHVQTFKLQVFNMILDINPPPKPASMVLELATQVFESMLDFFRNFNPKNVLVIVMSEEVTFAVEHHRCILSRTRGECYVDGVPLSGFPHVTNFRWEDLISKLLKQAIFDISDHMGMLLPGMDGGLPALGCLLPPMGRICFYFLSEEDDASLQLRRC